MEAWMRVWDVGSEAEPCDVTRSKGQRSASRKQQWVFEGGHKAAELQQSEKLAERRQCREDYLGRHSLPSNTAL